MQRHLYIQVERAFGGDQSPSDPPPLYERLDSFRERHATSTGYQPTAQDYRDLDHLIGPLIVRWRVTKTEIYSDQ